MKEILGSVKVKVKWGKTLKLKNTEQVLNCAHVCVCVCVCERVHTNMELGQLSFYSD